MSRSITKLELAHPATEIVQLITLTNRTKVLQNLRPTMATHFLLNDGHMTNKDGFRVNHHVKRGAEHR
jgi:hypothetical protein